MLFMFQLAVTCWALCTCTVYNLRLESSNRLIALEYFRTQSRHCRVQQFAFRNLRILCHLAFVPGFNISMGLQLHININLAQFVNLCIQFGDRFVCIVIELSGGQNELVKLGVEITNTLVVLDSNVPLFHLGNAFFNVYFWLIIQQRLYLLDIRLLSTFPVQ